MDLNEEMQRGAEARQIIENPLVVECMTKLKEAVIGQWSACSARDTEAREWLWQHYQAILKFEEFFTEVLNTGKMATQMHKEKTVSERIMKVVGL